MKAFDPFTPTLTFEDRMSSLYGTPVAGVDEAGRGPWAGPVVAAAVILDPENIPEGLNDSKKLTATAREELYGKILHSSYVGIGKADIDRIDQDNILQATLWAMAKAVELLPVEPAAVLIDGNKSPNISCPAETVVRGDSLSLSIAAASIVAKVSRDRIMCKLAANFPGYGWERNKGYGTAEHRAGLDTLGVTPHHRKSFKPVRLRLIPDQPETDLEQSVTKIFH